jgi:hypothetical protein
MQTVFLTHQENGYNNFIVKPTYFIPFDVIQRVCGVEVAEQFEQHGLRVKNLRCRDIVVFLQKHPPKAGLVQRVHQVQVSNEYVADVVKIYELHKKCEEQELPDFPRQINDNNRLPRRDNFARYDVFEE